MKVTLKKPHTHQGKPCKAGTTIDVPAHDAQWLANAGVIDQLPGSKRGPAAEETKA